MNSVPGIKFLCTYITIFLIKKFVFHQEQLPESQESNMRDGLNKETEQNRRLNILRIDVFLQRVLQPMEHQAECFCKKRLNFKNSISCFMT